MKNNLRKAAIQAIKEGNISQLRALKSMIGSDGQIPVFYQVLGGLDLYNHAGQVVKDLDPDFEVPALDSFLPLISRVIITFSTYAEMNKVFEVDSKKSDRLFSR